MTGAERRPSAAELVAAVAEFLDTEVRPATDGPVNFHARVAANALRIVQRELTLSAPAEIGAALAGLDCTDEPQLAAAIRSGELDDRTDSVMACLRILVRHRLAIDHPGYDRD